LVWPISGEVLFTHMQRSLIVTASPKNGSVLKGGEDKITVTWMLNQTFPAGTDSAYKTIKVNFCYAPISQVDRAWRKTVDIMAKDKTCQFKIVTKPYNPNNKTVQSFETTVEKFVPTATYFVRAYAHNSDDIVVGYGQTTDALKKDNLFKVEAVSGRHLSMDIASIVFSGFSVVALFGFFINEKRKGKSAQQK